MDKVRSHSFPNSSPMYLEFLKCKAPASPDFRVVLECWAPDDGSQWPCRWPRSNPGSLLCTLTLPPLLPAGLVEPGLHVSLPVLLKVSIGYHSISIGSHVGVLEGKTVIHQLSGCYP